MGGGEGKKNNQNTTVALQAGNRYETFTNCRDERIRFDILQ